MKKIVLSFGLVLCATGLSQAATGAVKNVPAKKIVKDKITCVGHVCGNNCYEVVCTVIKDK